MADSPETNIYNNGNGKNGYTNGASGARWQIVVSAITAALVVGGALIAFIVQIDNLSAEQARQNADMENLQRQNSLMNDGFNQRMDALSARINSMDETTTRESAALSEIETQFCASDIVRNMSNQNIAKLMAILWRKVMGDTMPAGDPYYPMVCNRAATVQPH